MAEMPNKKGDAMGRRGEVAWSRRVLAEFLDMDPADIHDGSKLGKDLHIGEAAGPVEIADLWSRIEEAAGVKIPKQMRVPGEELLARTAEQFDAVVAALTSQEEPHDEDAEAGKLEQKILDSSEEIPSKYP